MRLQAGLTAGRRLTSGKSAAKVARTAAAMRRCGEEAALLPLEPIRATSRHARRHVASELDRLVRSPIAGPILGT